MSFKCGLCHSQVELKRLSGLPCSCLICMKCSIRELEGQICRQYPGSEAPANPPPLSMRPIATNFEVGETVLYLTKDGVYVEAVLEIIDITVQPPQYGVQLPGRDDLRFTEEHRLCATQRRDTGALQTPGYSSNGPSLSPFHHHHHQQHLAVQCPCCRTPVSLPDLRLLVPQALAAWEAERTSAWLRHHNIITCPRLDCGALIQRVPSSVASANGGGGGGRGTATSTACHRRSLKQQRCESAVATAHKELHRYRCGACQRDFCDACLAAPYHDGLTCRQAQAPDCLMCGGKVDVDRIEQLLPTAAAAAAAAVEGESSGDSIGGRKRVGSGGGGGGAVDVAADASLGPAMAVVQRASRAELLRALKNKLGLDTVWCLERRDLEKAFLHWGCRTCSSPECSTRLRGMCGRPLACGHWCCGLRGEGEAVPSASTSAWDSESAPQTHSHPRCVECGFHPKFGSSAFTASASTAAAAAAAALMTDCCFCWEPLSSAPCIEMACAPRHMCHLHCALARLNAGYPGPHISFMHLYCPLCRSGGGGGGGGGGISSDGGGGLAVAAAGGLSPGGSSLMQTALAPVHLDHPALRSSLAPHLALRAEVVAAARARIKMDPVLRSDPELQPGGRYDGRPADYGMEKLTFYKCSKCVKVYYGGQRACGAAADAAAAAAAPEQQQGTNGAAAAAAGNGGGGGQDAPVCGECCARSAGTNCPRHGTGYIEWKCRFCCSLASWFCFGTTHMCEPCHRAIAQLQFRQPAVSDEVTCREVTCGLKGIPHPPPGKEACLGCAMCRRGYEAVSEV